MFFIVITPFLVVDISTLRATQEFQWLSAPGRDKLPDIRQFSP